MAGRLSYPKACGIFLGKPGAKDMVISPDGLNCRWYVRANCTVDQARVACGEVQPLARGGAPAGEVAFLTSSMTEPQVQACLSGLDVASLFRVLG